MFTKIYTYKITGETPISFSKEIDGFYSLTAKQKKEQEYGNLRWQEKAHYDEDENVIIPPRMIRGALTAAASYLSEKVPGAGNSTFTKIFKGGIFIKDDIKLGIRKEDLKSQTLLQSGKGLKGGNDMVPKTFPILDKGWSGDLTIKVLDSRITEDVLTRHLEVVGDNIGIGRYRPANNGDYGRFSIKLIKTL